jgi:hypothetical protein
LKAEHVFLQSKHATLERAFGTLKEQHTTLQSEHISLAKTHATLQTNHTCLQKEHASLPAEHPSFKAKRAALERHQPSMEFSEAPMARGIQSLVLARFARRLAAVALARFAPAAARLVNPTAESASILASFCSKTELLRAHCLAVRAERQRLSQSLVLTTRSYSDSLSMLFPRVHRVTLREAPEVPHARIDKISSFSGQCLRSCPNHSNFHITCTGSQTGSGASPRLRRSPIRSGTSRRASMRCSPPRRARGSSAI